MNNKSIGVLVCVCLAVFSSKGQPGMATTTAPAHKPFELGVNLYSLSNYPVEISSYRSEKQWHHRFVPEIYFRYGKGKTQLRAAISAIQDAWEYSGNFGTSSVAYYKKVKGAGLKIGSQRLIGTRSVQPYLSLDIGYMYTREQGVGSMYGCFVYERDRPFLITKNFVSFDPAIGIRWTLKKGLIFSVESSVGLYYEDSRDLLYDANYYPISSFRFQPVQQLSVGYRF